MRIIAAMLLLCCVLGLAGAASAADERASCDDLTDIADALDVVAEGIADVDAIRKDGKLDRMLGETITSLKGLAAMEKDPGLDNGIRELDEAWKGMDWSSFKVRLETVIAIIDGLYLRDCR